MQNKVKSKDFISNAMKVFLTLCVSVMCFVGMSAAQRVMGADDDPPAVDTKVFDIQDFGFANMPVEAACKCTVQVYTQPATASDISVLKTVNVKVTKKMNSQSSIYFEVTEDPYPTYEEGNFVITEDGNKWKMKLKSNREADTETGVTAFTNDYSRIVDVTPTTTIISAKKRWTLNEAKDPVAVDTVVEFTLNIKGSTTSSKTFYVKKTGAAELKVSTTTNTDTAYLSVARILDGYKAIFANITDGATTGEEVWNITITGYDTLDDSGVVSYKVTEDDIINSKQGYLNVSQNIGPTDLSGNVITSGKVTYTLQLNDATHDIISIEKNISGGKVSSIVVKGLHSTSKQWGGELKDAADCATCNTGGTTPLKQGRDLIDPDTPSAGTKNQITFSENPETTIKPSDIIAAGKDGVVVTFSAGGIGDVKLTIMLNGDGKLECKCDNLPAKIYHTQPETGDHSDEIEVDHYYFTYAYAAS